MNSRKTNPVAAGLGLGSSLIGSGDRPLRF